MAVLDGFWLPQTVKQLIGSPDTEYGTLSLAHGRPCSRDDERGVTVRWPRLDQEQWAHLLAELQGNRRRAPVGLEYWDRLNKALVAIARRFAEPSDPLRIQALTALPAYTGYSEPMIRFTLGALDLMTLDQMPLAFSLSPSRNVANSWQRMPGLPGRLRFYATNSRRFFVQRLLRHGDQTLFEGATAPELAVGYGAGNVPGTALLIAFLAQATTLASGAPPAVVVKNSRREPIFTSLVLQGIEDVDPDLVSSLAILIWDYEDEATQKLLMSRADLVIAAASDLTIAKLQADIGQNGRNGASPGSTRISSNNARFHAHGHKVSFSTIGSEVLAEDLVDEASGQSLLDIVTRLAALDSVFWDQHGCLSSRVHFVETGGAGHYTAVEYAARLTSQLQILADFLPRGAWPRRTLYDRFDRYKLLETTGQVQVLSNYDDEYLVVLDQRPVNAASFQSVVNDCQGRVVIVRPVADLMEVPDRFLPMVPAENLQSLSVAVGHAGGGLTDRFLRFADACGARGVTAIRTVGRGAFPQLSYSWDGLIPLDLVRRRPAGWFTTIEFDAPWEQMLETHRTFLERGAASTDLRHTRQRC